MRTALLCVIGLLLASGVSAQTFPLAVKAYWLPNNPGENVTGYTIALDGGTPIAVGPGTTNDTNCPLAQYPAGCVFAPLSIPSAGQHTFSVVAINAWGSSNPMTITVNISNPGAIVWVKVAK